MIRDGLTGLLNQETTQTQLKVEINRARRGGQPVVLALIDIDHFKAINDTHGHAIGDTVIRSLAHLLRHRLRMTDIVGRIGGEEFAAVLTNSNAEACFRIFDDLRAEFAAIDQQSGENTFHVTISCGLADFPAHDTPQTLFDGADQALFAAKHAGRNRVIVANHPQRLMHICGH